jgi:DNA helicase-2/ATP-dependent DNA helicase PcrA
MIRRGLKDPAIVEAHHPDARGIADAFDRYRQILAHRNLVDFDEQIYSAIELLLRDPNARRVAQTQSRHLLVDEFQDLTPAHLVLIRLLSAPTYDVFGVGDDDQVIYSHAAASPRFLIDYDHYFLGAKKYALSVNYRCPPSVIAAAKNLLTHNAVRINKEIHAPTDRSDPSGDSRFGRFPTTSTRSPRASNSVRGTTQETPGPTSPCSHESTRRSSPSRSP